MENELGRAQSSTQVVVQAKQSPPRETPVTMETQSAPPEEDEIFPPPKFTKQLKNVNTIELTNVHLETRIAPFNDPSLKIEWFVNGRPLHAAHRYRTAFEFDYVAVDLLQVCLKGFFFISIN